MPLFNRSLVFWQLCLKLFKNAITPLLNTFKAQKRRALVEPALDF